jgi:hypothetical protein
MSQPRTVRQVFNLLRADISPELMNDRELLRAAVAMVEMHQAPRDKPKRSGVPGREKRWAVDTVLERGWRVFSLDGTVVRGAFEAEEERFNADLAFARSVIGRAA